MWKTNDLLSLKFFLLLGLLSSPDPLRCAWEEAGLDLVLLLFISLPPVLDTGTAGMPARSSKRAGLPLRFHMNSRQSTKSLFLKHWHNAATAFSRLPTQLILCRFV